MHLRRQGKISFQQRDVKTACDGIISNKIQENVNILFDFFILIQIFPGWISVKPAYKKEGINLKFLISKF